MDWKKDNSQAKMANIQFLEEATTDYDIFIPWKKSYPGLQLMEWIEKSFYRFLDNEGKQDKQLFFFKNDSTYAFRLSVESLDIDPAQLWNFWKDQIKESGYVLKNSESVIKGDLTTNRYYFKPRLKFKVNGDQRYGNITLELLLKDNIPEYIILKCSWYVDQHFSEPLDFKELISQLTH